LNPFGVAFTVVEGLPVMITGKFNEENLGLVKKRGLK